MKTKLPPEAQTQRFRNQTRARSTYRMAPTTRTPSEKDSSEIRLIETFINYIKSFRRHKDINAWSSTTTTMSEWFRESTSEEDRVTMQDLINHLVVCDDQDEKEFIAETIRSIMDGSAGETQDADEAFAELMAECDDD